MVINRNIDRIRSSSYNWKRQNGKLIIRDNICLDTETTFGYASLIADSDGRYIDVLNFKDGTGLFEWLCDLKYNKTNNFFFNAEFDWSAILKWLPLEYRDILKKKATVIYEGYKITRIEKKEFTIGKIRANSESEKYPNGRTEHVNRFYDIKQFLPPGSLAKLSENTPYPKLSFDIGDGVDLIRYASENQYNHDVIKYCIRDCKATKYLTDNIIKQIYSLGITPTRWHSKASISKKYVLTNLTVDKLKMPSKKVLQRALNATRAAIIECHQMGVFENVYAPDIRSCYPSVIAELDSYSGNVVHGSEYNSDAAYGWYKVKITFDHPFFSPLWYPQVDEINLKRITEHWHPVGGQTVWICKSELEFFMDRGYITENDIILSTHILSSSDTFKPFHGIVHSLYSKRLEALKDENPIQQVYKIVLNSIYGLMLNSWTAPTEKTFFEIGEMKTAATKAAGGISEIYADQNRIRWGTEILQSEDGFDGNVVRHDLEKAGSMYAPWMAGDLLAKARIKLFTDLEKDINKGHVLAFATDAAFLTKMHSKLHQSDKLGDWDIKKHDKILQYGTGRRIVENNGIIDEKASSSRSLPFDSGYILKMLKEYGQEKHIRFTRQSPVKFNESLSRQEYRDNDMANVFIDKHIDLTLVNDKRHWLERYERIEDIFDINIRSEPFTVNDLIN